MFGDIYAGWLVDHMDQAAETVATGAAQGRCATVSIDQLDFAVAHSGGLAGGHLCLGP